MEITLDLPERTVRKVRAYGILGAGGGSLEDVLVGLIDRTVSAAIIESVQGPSGSSVDDFLPMGRPPRVEPSAQDASYVDHSGIASGLGDEQPEDDGATADEMAFVPKSGTPGALSSADVDHDMAVDDPQHEAKVDAPPADKRSIGGRAERVFAEIADMPEPAPAMMRDSREARRRKPLKSKAIVTGFSGDERSSF